MVPNSFIHTGRVTVVRLLSELRTCKLNYFLILYFCNWGDAQEGIALIRYMNENFILPKILNIGPTA